MLKIRTLLSILVLLITTITIGSEQLNAMSIFSPSNQWQKPISASLSNQFAFKVNQEVSIASEQINIKFVGVEEDSRCPSGVQCFWSGQVKIIVQITHQEKDLGEFTLVSKAGEKAIVTFDNYAIELLEVNPYPQKEQIIEISDYQITLIVTQQK